MKYSITEQEIKSYMERFNIDRETAIKEIEECMDEHYERQEEAMQEVYEDIISSSH